MQRPSVDDVARVSQISDPLIRNLEVTQGYHEIAQAFAAQTGGWTNWCTLATWASKQAGQSIRAQDAEEVLKHRLSVPPRWTAPLESLNRWLLRIGTFNPNTRWGRIVRAIPGVLDVFERTSDAVGRGNIKVYDEIGREFARFLDLPDMPVTTATLGLNQFLDGLKPGDPPEGQEYLKRAFTHYARAAEEKDDRCRAQWVLLANIEIGFHEQTRLQPEIAEALDVPSTEVHALGKRILAVLAPGSPAWWPVFTLPLAWILGAVGAGFALLSRKLTRGLITEKLMSLRLPDRLLILAEDMPMQPPPRLSTLDQSDLLTFLSPFFPEGAGSSSSCAARDWADLPQRMRYIARLFRAIQEDESLFRPPYTPEQVWQFRGGTLPDGDL